MLTFADREAVLRSLNCLNAIPIYANLLLELQEDEEIAVRAAWCNGFILAYAPDCIRRNLRVVRAAMHNDEVAGIHSLVTAGKVLTPHFGKAKVA